MPLLDQKNVRPTVSAIFAGHTTNVASRTGSAFPLLSFKNSRV
jgi:hypothetical protein